MAIVRMKLKLTVEGGKEKWEIVNPGNSCKTQDNEAILKRAISTPVSGYGATNVNNVSTNMTQEELERLQKNAPSLQTHTPDDSPPGDDNDPTHYREKDKDISLGYDT